MAAKKKPATRAGIKYDRQGPGKPGPKPSTKPKGMPSPGSSSRGIKYDRTGSNPYKDAAWTNVFYNQEGDVIWKGKKPRVSEIGKPTGAVTMGGPGMGWPVNERDTGYGFAKRRADINAARDKAAKKKLNAAKGAKNKR